MWHTRTWRTNYCSILGWIRTLVFKRGWTSAVYYFQWGLCSSSQSQITGKRQPVKHGFRNSPNRNPAFNKGSPSQLQRTLANNTLYPQRTQTPQKAYIPPNRPNPTPISVRHCFKCQVLGHIASDFPNRKFISSAEWETVKEEKKEEKEEQTVEEDEESPEE